MGMEKLQPVQIQLANVRIDGGTQARAALNDITVDEYAESIIAGANMPPVIVYFDGLAHWLADGFHRFHAHRKADKSDIAADIRIGTKRDAMLFSFGANRDHGLRRTNEDKRRVVRAMLADPEWSQWSDHKVAEKCGVSHAFVGTVRASLETFPVTKKTDRKYVDRHGNTSKMKVKSKKNAAAKPSKILPRPETKAEPEPLDVARDHARKQNAAIKALRADIAERDARIEGLCAELKETRENAIELAESLEACIKAGEGESEAAKEIKRLLGANRVLEATRDQYMTKCNELVKTVKALQRKAEKAS